jgi:hypothetical protein
LSVLVKGLVKDPAGSYRAARLDVIAVLWFFVPLLSVVFLKSVLYDGWRHMFFIYPAFLLICLRGLGSFFDTINARFTGAGRKAINITSICIILLAMAGTLRFMIVYHPYQNVYFNLLTGDMANAKDKFEMDYWGLSYREALEYVVEKDRDKQIKICVANPPGEVSALMLHAEDRSRLIFTRDPRKAEYFLSNYRWHKIEYPYKNEYFSIKVGDTNIMVVYDMTREEDHAGR